MSTPQDSLPDPTGSMSAAEFDFVSRHPGGFDREFFISSIVLHLAAYLEEQSLRIEEAQVTVQLESGIELSTIGAVAALTWVTFQTEDDETWIVPMSAVRRVSFKRRPGPPFRVGFTVTAPTTQLATPLAS